MRLGRVVQQSRKEKGLSQNEFTKSMRFITYFERGVIGVSLDTFYKIAEVFGASVSGVIYQI
jgi:transcriptional regulator with XRE-family HTH domain